MPRNGFALPLALVVSSALVLSTTTFQSLTYFRNRRLEAELSFKDQHDRLISAAMDFLRVASDPRLSCLLSFPFSSTSDVPPPCPDSDSSRFTHGEAGSI